MSKRRKKLDLAEQLRGAFRDSGMSRYMWTTGEEMSPQATRQLALFVEAYDKANRAKLRLARWWLGAVGGQIETLPGHSQELILS